MQPINLLAIVILLSLAKPVLVPLAIAICIVIAITRRPVLAIVTTLAGLGAFNYLIYCMVTDPRSQHLWAQVRLLAQEYGGLLPLDSVLTAIFTPISGSVCVLVFVCFLAPTWNPGRYAQMLQPVQQYLRVKTLLALGAGAAVTIILAVCGVPMALLFGFLTVVLVWIPNIGATLATALPLVVIPFGWLWLPVLIGQTLVHGICGNVLEPKLLGDALKLHPVTILAALIVWGLIWGIPGMLLAAPLTAILRTTLMERDSTRVYGDLLAGKFPE